MFKYFRGFTDSMGAFYIYIDVSKDFVGSGSEDERGRVWDRYSEHDNNIKDPCTAKEY